MESTSDMRLVPRQRPRAWVLRAVDRQPKRLTVPAPVIGIPQAGMHGYRQRLCIYSNPPKIK